VVQGHRGKYSGDQPTPINKPGHRPTLLRQSKSGPGGSAMCGFCRREEGLAERNAQWTAHRSALEPASGPSFFRSFRKASTSLSVGIEGCAP